MSVFIHESLLKLNLTQISKYLDRVKTCSGNNLMRGTYLVWCIVRKATILYDAVINEPVLPCGGKFIGNHKKGKM